MSKILGSWSGMRKYLEQEMLTDSLKGRVRYGCTSYIGMEGCYIFEICIDGTQIKRFSWETVNTYFIDNGYKNKQNPDGTDEYWTDFWALLEEYPLSDRTEYTDEEFCTALEMYRNQDILKSIYSDNALVRMFAILDRRVGKRTLIKVKKEIDVQPQWLQKIYELRFSADMI